MRSFLIGLSLFGAVSARAVMLAPGDVAIVPVDVSVGIPEPFPGNEDYLLDSNGVYKGLAPNRFPLLTFGSNNHLFVVSGAQYVEELDSSFNELQVIEVGPTASAGLLRATSGDFYVLDGQYILSILTPAGQLKTSFALPNAGGMLEFFAPAFDLAPDGCTLLYADGAHTGRRFNVCTGTALPHVAGGPTDVVRALADRGYVAVHGHWETGEFLPTSTLDFYDDADHIVRSIKLSLGAVFPYPDLTSQILDLSFDSDPRFLWVGAPGRVLKVRIADGAIVRDLYSSVVKLAVNGETRPTLAGIAAAPVPATSSWALAALACAIIALALRRLG
jgi:hypothetical protein